MVLGALYAWYGLIPLLLEYLTTDAQQAGLTTEWRLSNYAGFIVNLLCASAIGFQAPLITTLILRSGAISGAQMAASRRVIWFGAFVLGAFMSPPDPLSLFLVALPIMFLFEAALFLDRFTQHEPLVQRVRLKRHVSGPSLITPARGSQNRPRPPCPA